MSDHHTTKHRSLSFLLAGLAVFVFVLIAVSTIWTLRAEELDGQKIKNEQILGLAGVGNFSSNLSLETNLITHKKTPEAVKAIYISSWVSSSKTLREKILRQIAETEINTIVLDIKDSSGKIVIKLGSPELQKFSAFEARIPDIVEFIADLHKRDYYVIGRIAVFQDNHLPTLRPDLAMRRLDTNELWRDKKGMTWLDVSQEEVWDYTIILAREAYAVGFDEINFDYVRFPTDGDLSQIRYRNFDPHKETRVEALNKFFVYLKRHLDDIGVITSANLFGMTLSNDDDLGIGQILEDIAPQVDYVAPMLYPSHYPAGWEGHKNPATKPYEVVKSSLDQGIKKMEARGLSPTKLRPWLQDFDLGAIYTEELVRAQLEATRDAGLTSWMMWDSKNKYTISAYQK